MESHIDSRQMPIENATLDAFYANVTIEEEPESRVRSEAGRSNMRSYTLNHAEANVVFVTESVFNGNALKDFVHIVIEGEDITLLSAVMLWFIRQYRNIALIYLHKKAD